MAEPISATQVEFHVTTNLPLPIEVSAAITLAGQRDEDVYVGYATDARLDRPTTTFVVDGSLADHPLPLGEFVAEVDFYPNWPSNAAVSGARRLHASVPIHLAGNGRRRAQAALQGWVMRNVEMNVPWDRRAFEARLGPSEMGPSTLSPLHDAYYFPDADMTFIVNRVRHEVTIWRAGRVTQ